MQKRLQLYASELFTGGRGFFRSPVLANQKLASHRQY